MVTAPPDDDEAARQTTTAGQATGMGGEYGVASVRAGQGRAH